MNLKKIALAVAAGSTLLAAAPVFAQSRHDHRWDRDHRSSHSWRAPHYRPYYRGYYAAPRPYYYMPPAPAYYTPAPYYGGYYAPSVPVVSGRIPLGHHSSIGFSLPLN